MCYWILTVLGKVTARTNVHKVIRSELLDTDMKGWIENFDEDLEKWLDETNFVEDVGVYFILTLWMKPTKQHMGMYPIT